jgi:hypothetical protein
VEAYARHGAVRASYPPNEDHEVSAVACAAFLRGYVTLFGSSRARRIFAGWSANLVQLLLSLVLASPLIIMTLRQKIAEAISR